MLPVTDTSTTLRRLALRDLAAFLAYRADPDIARYQSWKAMDEGEATGFLTHMQTVRPLLRPGKWVQIAVADADSDALLGDMGLHLSDDTTEAELGITLSKAAQGQGHGLRATRLAVELVFAQTDVSVIRVWADARNAPSRALALQAGFTFVGLETTDGVEEAAFVLHRPTP